MNRTKLIMNKTKGLLLAAGIALSITGCGEHSLDDFLGGGSSSSEVSSSSAELSSSSEAAVSSSSGGLSIESYQHTTPDGKTMTVYYVLPPVINRDTRVLFTMHGNGRTAEGYARQFRPVVAIANVAVIAPLYDTETFGNGGYDLLNVGSASKPNPYSQWAFHYLDDVFEQFAARHKLSASKYILYGFSAGGQFAHRTYMFSMSQYLDYVIAGGSGFYTFLDETRNFPGGIKNLMEQYKDTLFHNLRNRNLYIVVGADDNDPNHPQISSTYNHQGMHRVERATNFFETSRNYALQNDINLNWELKIMDTGDHEPGPTIPFVVDVLTRNTRPASILAAANLSGQDRVYGTWYLATHNNATIITSNSVTVVENGVHLVAMIESIEPVTNTNAATRDRFPEGYRIRGVYTESNQNGTPVGSAYNRVWYISADNCTLNRSDSNINVWNRH